MCTRVVRTPKALCANAIVRAGYNGLESRAEAYATAQRTMEPGTVEGIHLFNTREFFETHEALEAVWLKTKRRLRINFTDWGQWCSSIAVVVYRV